MHQFQHMIPHFIDIGEMKNSYFKHFSIKSIFNPLELVEWISKSPKNMNFFVNAPILTYYTSFCRYQKDKQFFFQTFGSELNI